METLSKILGSQARIKVMRLFLLNKGKIFTNKEISQRSRVNPDALRKEIKILDSADFIKKKNTGGWYFNPNFKYIKEFEGLLVSADTLDHSSLIENFKKVGKLKLLVVSGIFIKNKDSRVDLLLVGEGIQKSKVEDSVKRLEAEIGVEIVYAMFTLKEFVYRLTMYDKLVRDILDFPHEVVLQSKELSTQALKKP
ncbi:MAG: replication/maintenance protein RepL [Patescibacteria group bacterium]